MRKLASIQKISDLSPISGADRIELATVNGWKVVVQKGLYEIGDLCVYCEIDSVLPLDSFPELEKVKGRIRTIKLRGQVSQGYCFPISVLNDIVQIESLLFEGLDVTFPLRITKYEPPEEFRSGDAAGSFPSHIIAKTDEDRIQSNLEYLEAFHGKKWIATLKCDGTSATYGYDEDDFFVCSRNLRKKDGDNVYWNIARKYNLENKLRESYLVIQGEICGPGIQKNRLGLLGFELFVFRIYDQVNKKFLPHSFVEAMCEVMGLKCVPTICKGDRFDFSLENLLAIAEGKYPNTDNEREGLVFIRNKLDDTKFGGRLSFKVISNKFLLGED